MKVLFFCNLIPNKLGAFEWLLITLGRECRAVGDALVPVFAAEPMPEVSAHLRAQGVRWRTIPAWSKGAGVEHPWRFCLPAWRLLREERPDVAVVHFGNELPSMTVSFLGKLSGLQSVKWVWQQDQQIRDPSALTARLSKIRSLSLLFDHLVAVYDGGKVSLLRRGIPDRSISVIYNSLKDQPSAREPGWLRRELELADDAVLIAAVAWLIPRKRIDFTLRAFAAARRCVAAAPHLLIVGEGPEEERLRNLAAELSVAEHVHFLGLRNDVRDILYASDLFVHASLAETCTYVISESMAVGIPAAVTDAGAACEQILDGQTGFVVAQDDLPGLASRLCELVDDTELRRQFGAAARKRWEARYRVEVSARKYHELYQRLAQGTHRPSPPQ